jgi:hypothetical protein
MGSTFQVLKRTGAELLLFGIGYALFFYLAHFTQIQSVVLAAVGFCAIGGYRLAFKLAAKQQPSFEPFSVSVQPNWYTLCQDFGLYDVEKWKELQEKCGVAPAKYSIMRNGFNFTMLSPILFYSDDHKSFFGELNFKIPVEELRPEPDKVLLFAFAPQFYIKRTLTGQKKDILAIEFGLITAESLKKSFHPRDDQANIPIACLPEIVFFGYTHPDAYNWDTMKRIEEQTKIQLTDFGWTQKERDPEDPLRWPSEINHKYFRVTYTGIS